MLTPYVTLSWDGRPRTFVRGDLETAWLIRQDQDPGQSRMSVTSLTAMRLRDDHGWSWGKAIEYAVASGNWDGAP